jgi:DNA-directed RNA polymerase specialized sigma subunit
MSPYLTDKQLTDNLKLDINTEQCLSELVNRHSGIFLDIVTSYVPKGSPSGSRDDLISDLEFYVYNAGLKYDHTKKTKFSTFLGNEAKWACLNQYNKNKKYLIADTPESRFMYENNLMEQEKPFVDEPTLKKIFTIIDSHPDDRVQRIFKLRYIDPQYNKLTPWKKVSKQLNMSIQGCINIHNSAIKVIRKELKNTHEFDI